MRDQRAPCRRRLWQPSGAMGCRQKQVPFGGATSLRGTGVAGCSVIVCTPEAAPNRPPDTLRHRRCGGLESGLHCRHPPILAWQREVTKPPARRRPPARCPVGGVVCRKSQVLPPKTIRTGYRQSPQRRCAGATLGLHLRTAPNKLGDLLPAPLPPGSLA